MNFVQAQNFENVVGADGLLEWRWWNYREIIVGNDVSIKFPRVHIRVLDRCEKIKLSHIPVIYFRPLQDVQISTVGGEIRITKNGVVEFLRDGGFDAGFYTFGPVDIKFAKRW